MGIAILDNGAAGAHLRRLRAVASAYERLYGPAMAVAGATAGQTAGAGRVPGQTALEVIARLTGMPGRIAVSGDGPWRLTYLPAQATLGAIASGTAPSWGQGIDRAHAKAIRRTPGAIFRFPFEDGPGELPAFITDWSPFVSACAIAVHPDHPMLAGTARAARPYFSGRYVRHILHGDLLPVWVADWVRAGYGTGAVVVNPGHSVADLEFARHAGLPIRFGLSEGQPGTDPATWPRPPIIRAGRAVRAGKYQGLDHAEAAAAYMRDLTAAGAAEAVTMLSLDGMPLATLRQDPDGDLTWSPARRGPAAGPDGIRVAVDPGPLLTAALRPQDAVIVSPDAASRELLWLRALRSDMGQPGPAAVILVATVIGEPASGDYPDGALLAAGRPDAAVHVRPELIQRVTRVISEYDPALLAKQAMTGDGAEARRITQARLKVWQELLDGNYPAALSATVATAKKMRRGDVLTPAEADAQLLRAYILFGLSWPGYPRPWHESSW
jgi:leucyl-tRNA synthetase